MILCFSLLLADDTKHWGARLAILHLLHALLSRLLQFAVRFKSDLETLYACIYSLVARAASQFADLVQRQSAMHSSQIK